LRLVVAQLASAASALQLVEREREARAGAELAAHLRDEFLATLSHELRAPLSAIVGWAHILEQDLGDRTRAAAAIEVIQRNAQLQTRLITDLLDVSRIISGNMRLDLQPVRLADAIAAAVESVMPAAVGKSIRIELALERVEAPVNGDPTRIQQMLRNLLTNAVKFTPFGGRVRVSLSAAEGSAEIRVSDDGEGIDLEFLPFVFDQFRQADGSRTRRHGGLGLGLTIVKHLADLHGGRVRAASAGKGRGATFVLELPLAIVSVSPDVEGRGAAKRPLAEASRQALAGVRVLVVDDEPDSLAMMRQLLERHGARVRAASSADAALEIAGSEAFDVIASDIAMPGLDGHGFLRELRKRGIESPALALTAFALADDRARALAAGYRAHIAKPFDPAILVNAVAQLARTLTLTPPRSAGG
jgi:CheY-like chemotaxis protein